MRRRPRPSRSGWRRRWPQSGLSEHGRGPARRLPQPGACAMRWSSCWTPMRAIPAGGGAPLGARRCGPICREALAARPQAFSVLACDGEHAAFGLVNCIEGFSTFACRPLVNVHDVVVLRKPSRPAASRSACWRASSEEARAARRLQAHARGAVGQPQRAARLRARRLCRLPARPGLRLGDVPAEPYGTSVASYRNEAARRLIHVIRSA